MIFPREALDAIGGWDERFRGWGGEDVAFLRALDTLFGKHKTSNNAIFHLWHSFNKASTQVRMWGGQEVVHPNRDLTNAYHRANRQPSAMRQIVEAGARYRLRRERLVRFIQEAVKGTPT